MWRLLIVLCIAAVGCRFGFDARSDRGSADANAGAGDATAMACSSYVRWGSLTSAYRQSTALDWVLAEADCESDGGHLAVVSDVAERDELRTRLATDEFWIGLSDRITEGQYLEVTGASPAYSAWPGSTPSNTGEDCVEILSNSAYEDTACVQLVALDYACECDGATPQPGSF